MINKKMKLILMAAIFFDGLFFSKYALSAITLDRTRIIFDGGSKSSVMTISNNNTTVPYLAQGWIENEKGEKIMSPLIVLPPIQRIEPGKYSQLKIEGLPEVKALPRDRESLFFFNLREIPPKADKPNTLQIALQTRVKLFYRPKEIKMDKYGSPVQEKVTLFKNGNDTIVHNPTPYYLSIVYASGSAHSEKNKKFSPVMVPPFKKMPLGINPSLLGSNPILTYINDYGGRPTLNFQCLNNQCHVNSIGRL